MRSSKPIPLDETRASLLAWAKAKGIQVREERGWIILERSGQDSDPVLRAIAEALQNSAYKASEGFTVCQRSASFDH